MIFLEPYKKYADFSGRSRRKEYWLFALFYMIICLTLSIIGIATESFWLYGLFLLASFIPTIAVGVRRLHDTNRTGWWILISLVPLIGAIWFIVLCCFDSDPGDNRFGKNPKL